MIKCKLLLLIIFITFTFSSKGQIGLPLYEQSQFEDFYSINPAFAGSHKDLKVARTIFRSQPNNDFSENVNLIAGSFHTRLGKGNRYSTTNRVGVGFLVYNDQNSPTNQTGIKATFSYHIPFKRKYETKKRTNISSSLRNDLNNKFSFGISLHNLFYNVNSEDFNPRDPGDPLLVDQNLYLPQIELGGYFRKNNLFGGVSVVNIPLANNTEVINGLEPSPTNFIVLAGFDYYFNNTFSLRPSIRYYLSSNAESIIDISTKAYYTFQDNYAYFGFSYRNSFNSSDSQALSVQPILGVTFNDFTFGYSYILGLSDIASDTGNTHLITLGLNF